MAREAWEGGAASAPVTLTVELNDVNDNQPRLPVYPPVSVQAGAARRTIAKVGRRKMQTTGKVKVLELHCDIKTWFTHI